MTKYFSYRAAHILGHSSALASAHLITNQGEAEAVRSVMLHITCMILSVPEQINGYLPCVKTARSKHPRHFERGVLEGVRLSQSGQAATH